MQIAIVTVVMGVVQRLFWGLHLHLVCPPLRPPWNLLMYWYVVYTYNVYYTSVMRVCMIVVHAGYISCSCSVL